MASWLLAGVGLLLVILMTTSFYFLVGWGTSTGSWYVYVDNGQLCWNPDSPNFAPPRPWYGVFEFYRIGPGEPFRLLPRFYEDNIVKIPLYMPIVLLLGGAVYPLLPVVVRRRRRRQGLCTKCGYCLFGLEHPRCPECGTEFERSEYHVESKH